MARPVGPYDDVYEDGSHRLGKAAAGALALIGLRAKIRLEAHGPGNLDALDPRDLWADEVDTTLLPIVADVAEDGGRRASTLLGVAGLIVGERLAQRRRAGLLAAGNSLWADMQAAVTQGAREGLDERGIWERLAQTIGLGDDAAIGVANWRASRLGETEAVGTVMQASGSVARQGGLTTKTWQTKGDAAVREAHVELAGASENLDSPFFNSLGWITYPGDSNADPSNFIGCRCWLEYGGE